MLWHGLLVGLVALIWMEKDVAEVPSRQIFDVFPDTYGGGTSAGTANPGGSESTPARHATGRLFVAPPSVQSWTPPPVRNWTDAAAPAANHRARPARTEASRPAGHHTTYGEYLQENGQAMSRNASFATPRPDEGPSRGPRVVIAGPGPGAGNDRSASVTVPAGDEMARYFAGLLRQLGERHVKPDGLSDLLNAGVSFTVAADGSISDLRIVRSSGNAEFDRSVREAFARVKLPGRPDGKTDGRTLTFRMQEG